MPAHFITARTRTSTSASKRAHCFKCGWSGDVVDYLVGTRRDHESRGPQHRLAPDLFKDDVTTKRKVSGVYKSTNSIESPHPIVNAGAQPRDTPNPRRSAMAGRCYQCDRTGGESVLGSVWPKGPRLLRGRGLTDHTIYRFRLGYVSEGYFTQAVEALGPSVNGKPRGIHVARGITIPWVAPGSTYNAPKGDPPRGWAATSAGLPRISATRPTATNAGRLPVPAEAGSTVRQHRDAPGGNGRRSRRG